MQAEVPPANHQINGNTHVNINLMYLAEVFFGKWYLGAITDIFNILLAIVYFRTTNLNDGYDQILLQNSIIATLFTIGISLLMRISMVVNATRYYGQNLKITDADDKIIFKNNKIFLTFSVIICMLCQIPRILIFYYFIPLTKSTICDLYGSSNCDMLKAFCVVNLIVTSIFGIILFFGLMVLPALLTGISKDIATFVRDNVIGLLCGNSANSVTIDVN